MLDDQFISVGFLGPIFTGAHPFFNPSLSLYPAIPHLIFRFAISNINELFKTWRVVRTRGQVRRGAIISTAPSQL
jgi:hypothetical protein